MDAWSILQKESPWMAPFVSWNAWESVQFFEAENGEPSYNICTQMLNWSGIQAEGTAESCIATRELENSMDSEKNPDEEEVIMNIAATAYAGTLASTITNWATLLTYHSSGGADTVSGGPTMLKERGLRYSDRPFRRLHHSFLQWCFPRIFRKKPRKK